MLTNENWMIFARHFLPLILNGTKTQTRRPSDRYTVGRIYFIRDSRFTKRRIAIRITRKRRQRLGEITPEEIKKEGFSSLQEFKSTWRRLYGRWTPDREVTVYEFECISQASSRKGRSSAEPL